MWSERKNQFQQAIASSAEQVFFDRGVHDVVAYLNYTRAPIPSWEKELNEYKYDLVFLIKPELKIYRQDEDRMETFEEAIEVHKHLEKTYLNSGIKTIAIPFTTPEKRLELILKHSADG